jgi:hypothetical protein
MNFNNTIKTSIATIRRDAMNGGKIFLYSATKPVVPGDALTDQIHLVTLTLNDPSGTVTNGVWTLDYTATQFQAIASGDIAWARWFAANDDWIADSEVGGMSSTAPIKIDNVSVFTGGRILVLSSTMAEV